MYFRRNKVNNLWNFSKNRFHLKILDTNSSTILPNWLNTNIFMKILHNQINQIWKTIQKNILTSFCFRHNYSFFEQFCLQKTELRVISLYGYQIKNR